MLERTGLQSITQPREGRFPKTLSPRESQILELLAMGFTEKTIEKRLSIAIQTVKNTKASIFVKLGVNSSIGAVAYGIRNGLLDSEQLVDNEDFFAYSRLTQRQKEVLEAVANTKGTVRDQSVLTQLAITENTLKTHLVNIFPKLSTINSARAVVIHLAAQKTIESKETEIQ